MNERRGDPMLARLHDESAERQSEAAASAEAVRQLDAAVEGDELEDARSGERD
ncbi:MAG TPA: hypothetical protein VFM58_18520 [Solirubrobacteraceae bacterium]|nr:hypothetical protein [Solirubrobacteraceae bacterium]